MHEPKTVINNYTERWVLAILHWTQSYLKTDRPATYVQGGSMGGSGAVAMCLHYPKDMVDTKTRYAITILANHPDTTYPVTVTVSFRRLQHFQAETSPHLQAKIGSEETREITTPKPPGCGLCLELPLQRVFVVAVAAAISVAGNR